MPCLRLRRPRQLLPLSLLRRYVKPSLVSGHPRSSDSHHPPPPAGETKRKDYLQCEARIFRSNFQTKGHQGGQGHGPQPNFNRGTVNRRRFCILWQFNSDVSFSSFRRRSLLSRYQRSSRRTYQKRTLRSSRRSLRVSVPSSYWSKLSEVLRLFCLYLLLSPHNRLRPSKPTYRPTINARITRLKLLEATQS